MGEKPELRVAAPVHATGAVEFVALEDVVPDETFRVRPDGDVSVLATSLGRLGQFVPVEIRPWPGAGTDGPRWQVVAGFRRLAAVRLLARERVLARVHADLSDEDAWGLALADALLQQPLSGSELRALRERLRATGVAPWADELVEEALVRAPVEEELRERFYEFLTRAEAAAAGTAGDVGAACPAPGSASATVPETLPEPENAPEPDREPAVPVPATGIGFGPGDGDGDGRDGSGTAVAAPAAQSLADGSPPPASPTWGGALAPDETPAPAETAETPAEVPASTETAPETPTQTKVVTPAEPVTTPWPAAPPVEAHETQHEAIELTCDELARDVAARFSQLDQDLALLYENWGDVAPEERRALIEQARYVAQILPFMEKGE